MLQIDKISDEFVKKRVLVRFELTILYWLDQRFDQLSHRTGAFHVWNIRL